MTWGNRKSVAWIDPEKWASAFALSAKPPAPSSVSTRTLTEVARTRSQGSQLMFDA